MRNGLRTWVTWALISGAAAGLAWVWVEAGPPVTIARQIDPDSSATAATDDVDAGLRWLALIAAGVVAVGYIGVRRPER